MSNRDKARELAQYGRYGDSLLLHVHPIEVQLLDWAAKAVGHPGLTTNPHTGMPEAFSYWDILPIVAGAAGTVVGGPMGAAAGSALGSAISTGAQGGTAADALKAGVMSGTIGAATGGLGGAAGGVAGAAGGATGAAGQVAGQAAGQTASGMAGQTAAEMMGQQAAQSATQAAAAPGAGALAAESAQMSALPQAATVPGLETYGAPPAGMTGPPAPTTAPTTPTATPSTPSDLKAWESTQPNLMAGEAAGQSPWMTKAKEFAGSKYAAPAAMMGATAIGAGIEQYGQHKAEKKEKKEMSDLMKAGPHGYMTYDSMAPPERAGGPTSESRYFRQRYVPNYAAGGGVDMEASHGDGMADKTKATIDEHQPAALSSGEFVVPADVVSGLGNGSSGAGVKVLKDMMARVRKKRTGRISQAPKINPKKVTPK